MGFEQYSYRKKKSKLDNQSGIIVFAFACVILHFKYRYTKPKSQHNSGLFCKLCTSRACIRQKGLRNIIPSYLSIACNINFDRQSLEHEETTDFIEVGCKYEMHGNLPVFGM